MFTTPKIHYIMYSAIFMSFLHNFVLKKNHTQYAISIVIFDIFTVFMKAGKALHDNRSDGVAKNDYEEQSLTKKS